MTLCGGEVMPLRPCTRVAFRPHRFHSVIPPVVAFFWWRGRYRGVGIPTWFRLEPRVGGWFMVRVSEGMMPERPNGPLKTAAGAPYGGWGKSLPMIAGWLCDAHYPDGEVVGATQLQLRREGPITRATLKIADQSGLKVSAIAESPEDALAALELVLSAECVPWEKDSYPLASVRKGKK